MYLEVIRALMKIKQGNMLQNVSGSLLLVITS